MALKTPDQNPSIDDIVLFNIYTTDVDGEFVDPYEVNYVTVFFVERDHNSLDLSQWDESINNTVSSFFYRDAVPVRVYGTDDAPAWLSTDTTNSELVKMDDDGHFQLQWTPQLCREGDYFLCVTWTPMIAGDLLSNVTLFHLAGPSRLPVIPSHTTDPNKYPTLMDRYIPSMFKRTLMQSDISPEVIQKTNLAVGDGFSLLENFYNQLIDLLDANVVNEAFLPYLANFFRMKLRSQDPTLWRRQVKNAIHLYKKRGTLGGLQEALAQAGINFKSLTHYWQIVSKATWQEAFVVEDTLDFRLSKRAKLPVDAYNFAVSYRLADTTDWVLLDPDQYLFTNASESTAGCPEGTLLYTTLSITDPDVDLSAGDMVLALYKIAEPLDQGNETYIQGLPLADQRDEMTVTAPVKNWNVRLIGEDDLLFDTLVPYKHAFAYPVVWGKVRTEFPYNENAYNMEEYNGSTRDSTNPCDMDVSFYDTCSACRASKVSVDLEIEDLSSDRIEEAEEIVKDFLPFHAQIHAINYTGLKDEIIPPQVEELECLIQGELFDGVTMSQDSFNRIVFNGLSDDDTAKRDELSVADTVGSGSNGVGNNRSIVIFCPGVNFGQIIKADSNLLEVLSGANSGEYELASNGGPNGDVVGLTTYPLNQSGFPFRFSNIQYSESAVSVYQDNQVVFSDAEIDFSLFAISNDNTWKISVLSGLHTGIYTITSVLPDNSLVLAGWSGSGASGLSYHLLTPTNVNVSGSTTGLSTVNLRGRVETDLIENIYDVKKGDWIEFGGDQFKILFFGDRTSVDKVYIDGYSDGDQVGVINIRILRRLVTGVGYFNYRGMKLTTVINYESSLGIQDGQNPLSNPVENSEFVDNYAVLIGGTYYQMSDIDGNDIYLTGPVLNWGVDNDTTNVTYQIIQFVNQSISIQDGRTGEFNQFDFVDRRGQEQIFVIQEESMSMSMDYRLSLLNQEMGDPVAGQETIWFTIEN